MPATCKEPSTYIVLKTSKVSTKKSLSKQGKTIIMRCSATTAAKKYATAYYAQKKRSLKKVYLYRKGKVMTFKITSRKSKKTGKKVFVAKRMRTVSLKTKSKKMSKSKSKKSSFLEQYRLKR